MALGPNSQGPAAMMGNLAESIRRGRYPWWYPDEAKGLAIDYFSNGFEFLPLAASATDQRQVVIDGSAAFVVLSAQLVETDTGNTTFLAEWPLLFRIQDGVSGRYLSNIPVHASNWFGTGEQPKYWDVPKIFSPNGSITVECQNLEATNRNVRGLFSGFKIFNFQP